VVFVCFGELAPPLIGVALMNVHRDFWEFFKNIKRMMNNVTGTIVPVFVLVKTFVCLEFYWGHVPRFRFEGKLG
jgi:hypothetical protein